MTTKTKSYQPNFKIGSRWQYETRFGEMCVVKITENNKTHVHVELAQKCFDPVGSALDRMYIGQRWSMHKKLYAFIPVGVGINRFAVQSYGNDDAIVAHMQEEAK